MSWTSYPVFVATIISTIGLCRIVLKHYDAASPRSLSELAADEQKLLSRFRNILLICGVLFAITIFWYIAPRTYHNELIVIFGALMIGGELIAACLPARSKTLLAHSVLAYAMAAGMLGLAVLFVFELQGLSRWLAIVIMVLMSGGGALTLLDKRRFILYEMLFIFLSHFSIIVATLGVSDMISS